MPTNLVFSAVTVLLRLFSYNASVVGDGSVKGFVSDGDIIRYMNGPESEANGFASMYPLWYNVGALDGKLYSAVYL